MHTRGVDAIGKFGRTSYASPLVVPPVATIPVQLALGLRSLVPVNNDADAQRRFAYALRAAMGRKGWKAPDLARAIGRDASTVSRWIDEKSVPNLLMVKALAGALGVTPAFLFDPPPVPDYPLADYLIDDAVASGAEEGRRRSQEQRAPDEPARSPVRPARAG